MHHGRWNHPEQEQNIKKRRRRISSSSFVCWSAWTENKKNVSGGVEICYKRRGQEELEDDDATETPFFGDVGGSEDKVVLLERKKCQR